MTATKQAWSISALEGYESCPRKYHALRIAKTVKEEEGEAIIWGKTVHSAFETFFRDGKQFDPTMGELAAVAEQVNQLIAPLKVTVHTEYKIALNEQLKPVRYFANDVWVRCQVDLMILGGDHAIILDWKTGKRGNNDDQLALMAACVMALRPEINSVDAGFVWLKETPRSRFDMKSYHRKDLAELWGRFLGRAAALNDAVVQNNFPPLPNFLCRRYCPVTTCEYNGK